VTVQQQYTTLTYGGDLKGTCGEFANLTASLASSSSNTGIPGKTISFTIGSQSITATTSSEGVASASITLAQFPGT